MMIGFQNTRLPREQNDIELAQESEGKASQGMKGKKDKGK
jgi:hypothetical protein